MLVLVGCGREGWVWGVFGTHDLLFVVWGVAVDVY